MTNDNRDDESGQFTQRYSDEDFLDAIDELGGQAGTQAIADFLDAEYDTAYSRLRRLEDEEEVACDRVGNSRLWKVE